MQFPFLAFLPMPLLMAWEEIQPILHEAIQQCIDAIF